MSATGGEPRDAPERPGREPWAPRVSVLVGLLLALAYSFAGPRIDDFCIDDAWIHLSYAKSLSLGEGLSYNPGDWETGFSSPLWVVLLAAWPTSGDPVSAVKLLGALLHAASAGLASALALELGRARASVERPLPLLSIALLAGCLCATAPTLLQSSSSGMEVSLTSCLLLACLLVSLREQWLLAAALGFAAELARPEALACLVGFGAVLSAARLLERRRGRERSWAQVLAPLSAPAGAGLALAAWMIYCQRVSGWPWPNTAYVKSSVAVEASLGGGLDYLAAQVLPWQPWYAGLGGLALLLAALWTELSGRGVLEPSADPSARGSSPAPPRAELLALFAAFVAGMLGTAASRPLEADILFYQARYFAIFAALPPVLIAMGIARTHRLLSLALVVPIALLTSVQLGALHELQLEQERGVALLHGDPSRFARAELPRDAVIAVEGAGSMRYNTLRSTEIIDIIGLNDAAIAHAPTDAAKACVLVAAAPEYMVLPEHIAAALGKVFVMRPLAQFSDPAWAQVAEPYEVRVLVLEVLGVRPRWQARCQAE